MPPVKKSANAAQQASAKIASNVANKAARSTISAVESSRKSAENVVKIGTNAVRELLASSAGEAQKAQEKVFAISRESAENMAKSADAVSKAIADAVASSRENIDALIETSTIATEFAQEIAGRVSDVANQSFAEQIELSKEAFACRTINDVFELQNKALKFAIENVFGETMKMSELVFEFTNQALEPLNDRMAQASTQLQKAFSQVA